MSTPDTPIQEITERSRTCAAMVLEGADDGPTRIGVFTDEDLSALDGISADQPTPTPWLTKYEQEVDPEIAASIALRGLIARGLVMPAEKLADEWDDLGDDPRRLYAADPVEGILTLRRTAWAIASFQRIVEGQVHTIVYYEFESGRAMEEEVTADGFHHFAILPARGIPERAQLLIDQDAVARRDGEPFSGAAADIDQDPAWGPVLADTRALTVVTVVRRDGSTDQYSFYATSDRLVVSRMDDTGADNASAEESRMTVVEAGPETVRELLDEIVEVTGARS